MSDKQAYALLKQLVAAVPAVSAEDLQGLWTGHTIFSSIIVPQPSKGNESEGCTKMIAALKGKSLPTQMRFSGDSSGSGAMTLTINTGGNKPPKPTTVNYKYEDGEIAVHQTVQGALFNMKGTARRTESGEEMSGSISINATSKGHTMSMSGNWSVSKK